MGGGESALQSHTKFNNFCKNMFLTTEDYVGTSPYIQVNTVIMVIGVEYMVI
jgi:hypothetical protein